METAELVSLAVEMRAKQVLYSLVLFLILFFGMSALVSLLIYPGADPVRILAVGFVTGLVGVIELHLLILLQMRALLLDLERKPSYSLSTKVPAEKIEARMSRIFSARQLHSTSLDRYLGALNSLLLTLIGTNTSHASEVTFTAKPFVAVRVTSEGNRPATVAIFHGTSRDSVALAEVIKTNIQIS